MNHYSLHIQVVSVLKNVIMMSINQYKPGLLVILDLSVVFDTVRHNVLFSRLKDMFCLSGKLLEWVQSYLEQHSQRVSVHGILSTVQFLLSGVLQCSILAPLVFTMYICSFGIIAQRSGVKYHFYSDDTQFYISLFVKCINMYEHITSVCRDAYYHFKNIHCLKHS